MPTNPRAETSLNNKRNICCSANEGRIEAVCEAGNVLLEENTPEGERVKQRIDDIRGLWDDLKELALARQEVTIQYHVIYLLTDYI